MKHKVIVVLLTVLLSSIASASDDSKSEKLNQLLNVMDMDSMVDSMYSQMELMMQNMAQEMGVQPDEKPIFDKYYAKMVSIIKEDMSWAKMEPLIADIYSRNFSEGEIDEMLSFYSTKTGQAIIDKMPLVMQESMAISQTFAKNTVPKMQALAQQLSQDLTIIREDKK